MKNNRPSEQLKKAWLIHWSFYSENEDEQLKSCGIQRKIVDILSVRRSLEECTEYVENLYKIQMLTFLEKLPLEHYNFGRRNRQKVFGHTVPLRTHYQSKSYYNLIKYHERSGDLNSEEYKTLLHKWVQLPQFVSVGYNPSLKATMVFNLLVTQNNNGSEILECDYPLENGGKKHRSYTLNHYSCNER